MVARKKLKKHAKMKAPNIKLANNLATPGLVKKKDPPYGGSVSAGDGSSRKAKSPSRLSPVNLIPNIRTLTNKTSSVFPEGI